MSKTKRFAVVLKGWPRLSETFIAQELAALEERGLDFELWSLRHPTDKKRHPLHDKVTGAVKYLPEYLGDDWKRVFRAWRVARKMPGYAEAYRIWRADLRRDLNRNRIRRFGQACVMAAELPDDITFLYAHFLHTPSSVTRYAALMRGLPWGGSAHAKDIWTSPDWEKQEKLSLGPDGAKFIAVCSDYAAANLREMATDASRVHLIYHGLDFDRFPAPPPPRANTDPVRFLSVGRLVEKKGFDRLLDALALLPADLNWHWEHIGGGDLKDVMRSHAERLNLTSRITWRGACDQPEVIEAMRAADLFILPSRVAESGDRDGLPNVLMEAASQNLAILSTPVAAIPEFIESGTDGLLSDDAPQALAEAITTLAQNPQTRAAYATAAHTRLHAEFGMNRGIDQLIALFAKNDIT